MLHTDIGEKIRRMRVQQKMTQAELAGDQITRNMLSRIENGAALPSLPTVWYLAERLGVPAGFLLAEGDNDRVWRKMSQIESIRRVLRAGDSRICLELCRDGGEADDEISLIMAECCLGVAVEEFHLGHLHVACEYLDEALAHAGATVYDTGGLRQTVALYFRFMRGISAMLYSENMAGTWDVLIGSDDPFGRYVLAREALDEGEERRVRGYLDAPSGGQDVWREHFSALHLMREGAYEKAREVLLRLLNAPSVRSEVLVYCVFGDLEICCREIGDFRGAYEYSQNKVAQLEKLLQE